jgi:hypothetical protein
MDDLLQLHEEHPVYTAWQPNKSQWRREDQLPVRAGLFMAIHWTNSPVRFSTNQWCFFAVHSVPERNSIAVFSVWHGAHSCDSWFN